MSLFFETLKIQNNKIQNLFFHNQRLNDTIRQNFHIASNIDLSNEVQQGDLSFERCKVIYEKSIKSIQFFPLIPRKLQSFKVLETNITYNYKSVDRDCINELYLQKGSCDDILMINDGLLTDTSIANIAFFDGKNWITPKRPLLKGTMRASLLKKQLILEKDVKMKDIKNASRFALMNALIGFHEVKALKLEF